MRYLRTNTATIVTVGPFFDKTDGVTLETGLTITNERISLVVDANDGSAPTLVLDNVTGATSGTANDLNYITNCDAGLMQLELAAANLNYLGRAFLTITDAANHCPVFHEFMILPAVIFDAMIAGTDLFDVSVTQIAGSAVSTSTAQLGVNAVQLGGTAQTGRDVGASVLLSSGTGTGQLDITLGVVKANLVQILASALSGTAAQISAAFTKFFDKATPTGTINSFPDAVAGAAGGLFIAGTNAATAVTTALTANITGNVSGSVGSVTGAVGSVAANGITATSIAADAINAASVKADAVTKMQSGLATPTNITAGTITTVTNLTNAPTNGDLTAAMKASVNAEVDSALNTAIPGSPTADSINQRIVALDTLTEASGSGDLAAILTDTNELQTDWANGGRLDLILDAASAPSAATVADAVWDETLSGHAGVGSAGAALSAAGGSGDPWATALPGAYGAGTAGKIIGDNLNAPVGTVDTVVDAIKTKTDNLPAAPAATGDAMTLANGAITAAVVATGAIDADALAADAVDEILDEVVEGSLTMRQMLRLFVAALAGKSSGGGSSTLVYRDNADTKNRITATMDANGNRMAVTLDAS